MWGGLTLKNTKETNAKLFKFKVKKEAKKIAKKLCPGFF
jgi:hypothetical protein